MDNILLTPVAGLSAKIGGPRFWSTFSLWVSGKPTSEFAQRGEDSLGLGFGVREFRSLGGSRSGPAVPDPQACLLQSEFQPTPQNPIQALSEKFVEAEAQELPLNCLQA